MAKRITWFQAAEILGISCRQMQRWHTRFENTVSFANRSWQLERTKFRSTLAGCRVTVHEHLDRTVSITFGPHRVGRYTADGQPAMEMTPPRKATKALASQRGLEKSGQKAA